MSFSAHPRSDTRVEDVAAEQSTQGTASKGQGSAVSGVIPFGRLRHSRLSITSKAPGPLTPVAHGSEADGQAPEAAGKNGKRLCAELEPMFVRLTDLTLFHRPGGGEPDNFGSKYCKWLIPKPDRLACLGASVRVTCGGGTGGWR